MYLFSTSSLEHLATCHPDLQKVFIDVIKRHDCTIICGHRDEKAQEEAFALGTSRDHWPHSHHNATPSRAVDVMPYPIDWRDLGRIEGFAKEVKSAAEGLGVKIVWGGDWPTKWDFDHWQLG